MLRVTILIPTYNERTNLKELIPLLYREIYPQAKKYQFTTLVVDDCSPDGSKSLLRTYAKKFPRFFVSSAARRGIGAAMKRGIRYALAELSPDILFTLEADFVVDPREILPMLQKLESADVVLAVRTPEADSYGGNQVRRAFHRIATDLLARGVAGFRNLHDFSAACRVVRVNGILDTINLNLLPDGYAFFYGELVALWRTTTRFTEHTISFQERTRGSSKMSTKDFLLLLREFATYVTISLKARYENL